MISGPRKPAPASIPAATRWFVWIFLALFFVCAVARLEAWPLTGFRLFSHLRHPVEHTSIAMTVGADGQETPLWFTDLPRAYQGFTAIMASFRSLPAGIQLATCRAWLAEARRVRGPITALRIYSLTRPAVIWTSGVSSPNSDFRCLTMRWSFASERFRDFADR